MRRIFAVHVVLTILLCACASTDTALKAIDATGKSYNATADAFVTWSAAHQQAIVHDGKAAGKSMEQIMAELNAFRAKRDQATTVALDIEAALQIGPLLIATKDQKDIDAYMTNLLALVSKLGNLLQQLGFDVHGLGKSLPVP